MGYEINIDAIKKNYVNKKGAFKHNGGSRMEVLPYTTQYKNGQKEEIVNFMAAIGEFSRMAANKKKTGGFSVEKYYSEIVSEVNMDSKNRSIFIELIKELFLHGEKLAIFHPKALNYIESSSFNIKVGQFLFDVLYTANGETQSYIIEAFGEESNNILIDLMVKNLPPLEEQKYEKRKYINMLPYINDIFMEDFRYLLRNKDILISNVEKFFKFYYMFYVAQLSLVFQKTFEADISKPVKSYFIFEWENTGKGRLNTEIGWKAVESNVLRLYSHVNTLDMLNHNNENTLYSYVDLKERIDNMNDEERAQFIHTVKDLTTIYESYIDIKWGDFVYSPMFPNNECYDVVYQLFRKINYQFDNSGRRERQRDYGTWFVEFCKENFLSKRGKYGYIFTLSEEYTIFLTKLAVKDREKIKLKELFNEFERRGVFLDNESKAKLTYHFEKLNVLEKKSDSGDAQYVRRIL